MNETNDIFIDIFKYKKNDKQNCYSNNFHTSVIFLDKDNLIEKKYKFNRELSYQYSINNINTCREFIKNNKDIQLSDITIKIGKIYIEAELIMDILNKFNVLKIENFDIYVSNFCIVIESNYNSKKLYIYIAKIFEIINENYVIILKKKKKLFKLDRY